MAERPRFVPKAATVEKYGGAVVTVFSLLAIYVPGALFGVFAYWDGNRRGKTPSNPQPKAV